jgi:energy-coupling factor transport system substrate-specific component
MKKSNLLFGLILVFGAATFITPIILTSMGILFDLNDIPGIAIILLSIIYLILFILGIYFRFIESNVSSKEIALIAIFSAFAAVARIPFVGLPSIQPVSFLVLCAGYVFGPMVGFVIGGNTAFLSNIFLGQGIWTVYQVFAWGLFGIVGGFLRRWMKRPDKWILALIGFLLAFIYGALMNVWSWLLTKNLLVFTYSIPFDIAHAIGNFGFILLFGVQTIEILQRYQQRFFYDISKDEIKISKVSN